MQDIAQYLDGTDWNLQIMVRPATEVVHFFIIYQPTDYIYDVLNCS